MVSPLFGKLFKELRLNGGYTLRSYCRTFKKDPAYISRLERGKVPPPSDPDEIETLALSHSLKENTDEWDNFFTLATVSSGKIPDEIMSDEDILDKLPILLRTIQGQTLSEEKLKKLVELIKEA